MQDRLRQIRSSSGLNQADFAKSLGIGQSTLAMMEVGKRPISERHIKTICALYNVNEDWLKTGKGEMFIQTTDSLLDSLAAAHNLNETEKAIMQAFLELSPAGRAGVIEYAQRLKERLTNEPKQEPAAQAFDEAVAADIAETERKIAQLQKKKNI